MPGTHARAPVADPTSAAPPSQNPETAKVLEALQACQEEARRKHVGIYEFGDVDSEEEDDGGAWLAVVLGGACVWHWWQCMLTVHVAGQCLCMSARRAREHRGNHPPSSPAGFPALGGKPGGARGGRR